MAKEIPWVGATGMTLYAQIFNTVGQFWNTGTAAFENYATANIANYAIAMTEQGSASGVYFGDFPVAITTSGNYTAIVRRRAGASPAEGDNPLGSDDIGWTGTAVVPQVQLTAAGLDRVLIDSVYTIVQYIKAIGATTAGAETLGPATADYKTLDGLTTAVGGTADSDGNRVPSYNL